MAAEKGIYKIMILGDIAIVISLLVNKSLLPDINLQSIVKMIYQALDAFHVKQFFHVH